MWLEWPKPMWPRSTVAPPSDFAGFEDDRLVQRQMLKLVVFAEEDAQQDGVARNLHVQAPFIILRTAASTKPAKTADQAQHDRQTDIAAGAEPFAVVR